MRTESVKIANEIVKRTELWPDTIDVPDSITFEEIVYHTPSQHELSLTYFTQKSMGIKRPAVVFIHGGSWFRGDKRHFYRQALYLAQKYNLFSVCINYRLSTPELATYPSALHDCKCAVRWVRSVADSFNVDADRIGVCGGSAGAHLSAMIAVTGNVEKYEGDGPHQEFNSHVHLAVLYNGHYDMVDQLKDHVQDASMHQFFGGHPWEIPGVYAEASPFLWVHEKSPPMLFLHGEQDHYPHRQAIAMKERLNHFGVDSEVEIYEGEGHGWFNKQPHCETTTLRVAKFLESKFRI